MRAVVGALAFVLLVGCTLQYAPKPSPEELIVVPKFQPGQPVAIVNTTVPREVLIAIPPYDLQVDLRKYADSAIQLLQSELHKRGGVVQESSAREIRFDLTDMRVAPGAGRMRCVINFAVATGDGYLRGLEASGASWNFETAIDTAIVETVKAILTNDRVRRYLSE